MLGSEVVHRFAPFSQNLPITLARAERALACITKPLCETWFQFPAKFSPPLTADAIGKVTWAIISGRKVLASGNGLIP
jgi:hypothetical protein